MISPPAEVSIIAEVQLSVICFSLHWYLYAYLTLTYTLTYAETAPQLHQPTATLRAIQGVLILGPRCESVDDSTLGVTSEELGRLNGLATHLRSQALIGIRHAIFHYHITWRYFSIPRQSLVNNLIR